MLELYLSKVTETGLTPPPLQGEKGLRKKMPNTKRLVYEMPQECDCTVRQKPLPLQADNLH